MFATLLLLQAATSPVDPIEPAWQGKVQCHNPDRLRKTCRSIGSYARAADGAIQNTAVVLLNAQPAIVMTSVSPGQIKGDAICGKIRSPESGTFTVNGVPAPKDVEATLRKAVATATSSIADREICTSYIRDGDALASQVRVDGVRRPELDMQVLWVDPAEGFAVRP